MSRRLLSLRIAAGLAIFPIAALVTAQCGGTDTIDQSDGSTDTTVDAGSPDSNTDDVIEGSSRIDGDVDANGADGGDASRADAATDARDAAGDTGDASTDARDAASDAASEAGDAASEASEASDAASEASDAASEAGDAANEAGDAEAGLEGGAILAPALGAARSFAVLSAATITNTGISTAIFGDVGVSPGPAQVGLTTGMVTGGSIHLADAPAAQAQAALTAAYNDLAGRPCQHTMTSVDLGGKTLAPGVYCFAVDAQQMVGNLTLDAQGDPNAVWIFQIASTLTIANGLQTTMINGGDACNVYWQVGSSATVMGGASFKGNIFALASITLNTGAVVSPGRTLARTAAVTLDSNMISNMGCQ